MAITYYLNYTSSQSRLNYWYGQYNKLNFEYNNSISQYSLLQSQYNSLQTQYSNCQSQVSNLQSKVNYLTSQLNYLNTIVNSPSLIFMGALGPNRISQWPYPSDNKLILVMNNSYSGGIVLMPSIYTSNTNLFGVSIDGTVYSPGGAFPACYQKISDGYSIYLFVKPNPMLNITFTTNQQNPIGLAGDTIIPYSPTPYMIIEWDPWFSSIMVYIVEWVNNSNVITIWNSTSTINIFHKISSQ